MNKNHLLTGITILGLIGASSCAENGPASPSPTTPSVPVVNTIPQVGGTYVGDLTQAHYPTGETGKGTTGRTGKGCQTLTQTGDQVILVGWEVHARITPSGELVEPVTVDDTGVEMVMKSWSASVREGTLLIDFERGVAEAVSTLHRWGEMEKQPEGRYDCIGGAHPIRN